MTLSQQVADRLSALGAIPEDHTLAVEVLEHILYDGWWHGIHNGNAGVFSPDLPWQEVLKDLKVL